MTAPYKQICEHVFSGEPSRDDLINQLTEYRTKHEIACSTLELVKERRDAAQRALAAQCKYTKELEAERDELKAEIAELVTALKPFGAIDLVESRLPAEFAMLILRARAAIAKVRKVGI